MGAPMEWIPPRSVSVSNHVHTGYFFFMFEDTFTQTQCRGRKDRLDGLVWCCPARGRQLVGFCAGGHCSQSVNTVLYMSGR